MRVSNTKKLPILIVQRVRGTIREVSALFFLKIRPGIPHTLTSNHHIFRTHQLLKLWNIRGGKTNAIPHHHRILLVNIPTKIGVVIAHIFKKLDRIYC